MNSLSERRTAMLLALVLVALAATLRLLPHPANFAPVMAVAIFGGSVLPRKLAVWVPLAAMVITDMVIGFYDIMPIVWGCYVVVALASSIWLQRPTKIKGVTLTLAASLFFFAVTNLAVWAVSGMYAHTWQGLAQCYLMALPFLRNTALSDVFFTALLFGTFAAASSIIRYHFAQERVTA